MSCFPAIMISLLLQGHRSHHVHTVISSHHLSLADCLHLLLGDYCSVSFTVVTSTRKHNSRMERETNLDLMLFQLTFKALFEEVMLM